VYIIKGTWIKLICDDLQLVISDNYIATYYNIVGYNLIARALKIFFLVLLVWLLLVVYFV